MQIEFGQKVRSADGQDIGVIKHLILDPVKRSVKSVVVERGLFLTEDVELPLDAIEKAGEDVVSVSSSADEVANLPGFDESEYTSAPTELTRSFLGFPYRGVLWPVAYPLNQYGVQGYPFPAPVVDVKPVSELPAEVQEFLGQQDEENAVISEGAEVYSKDGEKIGEVHGLTFDDTSGQPICLVVRSGWFFHEDRELPASSIASVDDDVVYLNLYKEQMMGD